MIFYSIRIQDSLSYVHKTAVNAFKIIEKRRLLFWAESCKKHFHLIFHEFIRTEHFLWNNMNQHI